MKILILPDIHGRDFFKKPCESIEEYDKVIFLGDYFDPYDFENISVRKAIENFKIILDLKKNNMDKVVLLIGNHDCPYMYNEYYNLSYYHCRHSETYHDEISKMFNDNKDLFKLAVVEDNILFTHAGVVKGWLDKLGYEKDDVDINEIADLINDLPNKTEGIKNLYNISAYRGGYEYYGSCVWADVHEHELNENTNIKDTKQVFGHTLQAFYKQGENGYEIGYGNAIEKDNYKMLDTTRAYELNTETFTIKEIN